MNIFIDVLQFLQVILIIYLFLAVVYYFIYAFASAFPNKITSPQNENKNKFVVLIPGYKEDDVIVNVAKEALNQDYPSEDYDIVIIADSFNKETLDKLYKLPLTVNEVFFEKSSKSKAINKTLAGLPDDKYDAVMILDADNVMANNVLTKMNNALNAGYTSIQGHRIAKNTNTPFALLDAISEEINNYIFRKGHRVLGLSSALIGSGMAFRYQLYKQTMATIDSYGEDKELEFKLLENDHEIEYLHDTLIYDEKVSLSKTFVRQRTRWLFNQILYARRFFRTGLKRLITKGDVDYFDKMFQQLLPPRIILIGLTTLLTAGSFFYNDFSLTLVWLIIFMLAGSAFILAIPREYYTFRTLKAILHLPYGFLLMLKSLSQLQVARKGFGATAHTVNSKKQKKNNN
ncbi:MAG: glycosyltransferase family 2 protein [Bacteroidales bacterium]|nr:glycosyltransferase family 2 protein [Bacteroidales bacterium]MCF8336526.1 glycosyltransferase family 2 protein [Bacteroidales bacterium]